MTEIFCNDALEMPLAQGYRVAENSRFFSPNLPDMDVSYILVECL
jgi:hypothetical protein